MSHVEQINYCCDKGPAEIREAFQVTTDGTFAWRDNNPMYLTSIADLMHAEAKLLKLAHAMPGAVLPDAKLFELKARYTMWKMIRSKWHDSKRPFSARSGLDLPNNQHMKGSWNAQKLSLIHI